MSWKYTIQEIENYKQDKNKQTKNLNTRFKIFYWMNRVEKRIK